MRAAALALACAACGGRTAAPAARAQPAAIDWHAVGEQQKAMDAWRQLAPTGAPADLDRVYAAIPKEQMNAMAYALVRDGNFACGSLGERCASLELVGNETFDDPCLREGLIDDLLEFAMMDDADEPAPPDVVEAVARSGATETAYRIAFALPLDDKLRFLAESQAAGASWDAATETLRAVDSDATLRAVRDYHLVGAVLFLSGGPDDDALAAVLLDPQMPLEGKRFAIDQFFDSYWPHALDAATTQALVATTAAADCRLAHDAAGALADAGDPSYLVRRPATRDPDVLMRALCRVGARSEDTGHDWTPELQTFVGAGGLDVAYDQGDLQGNDVTPRHEHFAAGAVPDRILWILGGACTGTTCTLDGDTVRYTLAAGADGDLRLAGLELIRDVDAEARAYALDNCEQ
jgi:hypothetical protein